MPVTTSIGFSFEADGYTAAEEAVAQAKSNIPAQRYDLALVFSTPHYDPEEFLPVIFDSFEQTRVIGCSTAGIILPDRTEDRGIAVMPLSSETIRFDAKQITHIKLQEMRSAGRSLAKDCMTDFGFSYRKMFFFFIDGLNQNIPSFTEGIHDQLGKTFPIFGAGSSGDARFEKIFQFFQQKAQNDSAVGVMLGGSFQMGVSARHGWKPLGKPRIITDCSNNIIKTIDQEPAINLYKEFLKEEVQEFNRQPLSLINVRYPLGIPLGSHNEYLIRNTNQTLDDGSIVCQDKVTNGAEVHIMIGSKESCLLATQEAAEEVKVQLAGRKPQLILIFQSLMRHKLLGRASKEEISIIKKTLGDDIPLFGMLSLNETITSNFHSEQLIKTETQNSNIVILAVC